MRKIALVLAVLGLVILVIAFYPVYVQKPEVDGTGPLAVRIDARYEAPQYHSPLEFWQTHHMDVVNSGDMVQEDCLYCHDADTSCNNCHSYVGVKAIVEVTE